MERTYCALLAWLIASCVSIHERYHLRATGEDASGEPTSNYYRVTIEGWTCFSASQYASGLYDSDAVDALFGELAGKTVKVDGVELAGHPPREPKPGADGEEEQDEEKEKTEDPPAKSSPVKLTSLDDEPIGDKKLVLFLSTNADALVNQISSLISKNSIQQALTTMLLGDELQELETARLEADLASQRDRALAAVLGDVATSVKDKNGAEAEAEVVKAIQALARSSGSPAADTITDRASAFRWLEQHPEAFQLGGR